MKPSGKDKAWQEWMLDHLPTEPTDNARATAEKTDELGEPRMIYHRESIVVNDFMQRTMMGEFKEAETHWGGICCCSECSSTFETGWLDGGILVADCEDGDILPGWVATDESGCMLNQYKEGDKLFCPFCGAHCMLIRRSKLGRGLRTTTQIAELVNVGSTTCIIYFLVSRKLWPDGYGPYEFRARQALAISPNRKLYRFAHTNLFMEAESDKDKWELRDLADPETMAFNATGCYRNCIGAIYAKGVPPMEGTTGEKTAIDEYIRRGNPGGGRYLALWAKHPNVENLIRAGWDRVIGDALEETVSGYYGHRASMAQEVRQAEACGVNWAENKPHRMLGLTKKECRCLRGWNCSTLRTWEQYRASGAPGTAIEFNFVQHQLHGRVMVAQTEPAWAYGGIKRILRYLVKQKQKTGAGVLPVTTWVDYLRMQKMIAGFTGIETLTEEEIFPPDVNRAHDRAMQIIEENEHLVKAKQDEKYLEGFTRRKEEFAPLEWTDGELCIVVPEKPLDLVMEGRVLHHCVGGYSRQHVEDSPIFFVRHYRRPERSWYTLNESIRGGNPQRIQLHGYKNEAGGRLRIPQNVLDFVERWEREILMPFFENRKGRKTA